MRHTATLLRVLPVGLLFLLSAARPSVVSAGPNVWTTNGPECGDIPVLEIDPTTPTTLYAGTWGGGVFDMHQLVYRTYLPLILRGQ
jgi:hypothetical protein